VSSHLLLPGLERLVGVRLQQVLEGLSRRAQSGFAAECLAFDIRSRTDTLHKNVQRLPPATGSRWDRSDARNGTRADRFPSHMTPMRLADRFGELFADAVNARADDSDPVAAFLSGGVDSSQSCARRARSATRWKRSRCFNLPEADERDFIAEVVRHARRHSSLADAGRETIAGSTYRARGAARRDLLELPGDAMVVPLRHMRERVWSPCRCRRRPWVHWQCLPLCGPAAGATVARALAPLNADRRTVTSAGRHDNSSPAAFDCFCPNRRETRSVRRALTGQRAVPRHIVPASLMRWARRSAGAEAHSSGRSGEPGARLSLVR
jgi:hypothetical protein